MTLTELCAFVVANYPSLTVHRNGETCFGATSILDFNSSLSEEGAKLAINAALSRHAKWHRDFAATLEKMVRP